MGRRGHGSHLVAGERFGGPGQGRAGNQLGLPEGVAGLVPCPSPGVERVVQAQQRGFPGLAGHRAFRLNATVMKQIHNYRTYAFSPEASPSGAKYR